MAKHVAAEHDTALSGSCSPVLGDIPSKVAAAAKQEMERRLRLGLPVLVDRGKGIEDLSASTGTR